MVEVSIVICTFNRGGKVGRALECLLAMPQEPRWEAIIVDNASTDETAEVIASFVDRDKRFKYVYEPQQGLGAARDTAWRHASGKLISFTDDDCYVADDFVERVVQAFAERPDLGFMGGRVLLHDPTDAPVTIMLRTDPFDIEPKTYMSTGLMHGANMTFRREVLERIDGFDRGLGAGTQFPAEDIVALASAVWHGFKGGYDPRPTVSHHHGRKPADIPQLHAGYDAGRAAYFAKFISNPESRWPYILGFIQLPGYNTIVGNFRIFLRYQKFGPLFLRLRNQKTQAFIFRLLSIVWLVLSYIRPLARMFQKAVQAIRMKFHRPANNF